MSAQFRLQVHHGIRLGFVVFASDPVQALLDIYSSEGGPAQVDITLDDGPTTSQALNLNAGYQTVTMTLTGPIPPGRRTLTATLTTGGYRVARYASFEYGTTLPDLRPSAPWLLPSGRTPTQTLQVALFNEGQSAAPATTLALYAGTPATGTFIATLAVPGLDVGASQVLTYTWDRDGQAGLTLISARADAGRVVGAEGKMPSCPTVRQQFCGIPPYPQPIDTSLFGQYNNLVAVCCRL